MESETEEIVYLDLYRISKALGMVDGWNSWTNDDIENCLYYVVSKIGKNTHTLQLIGSMPTILAMTLTAKLYPKIPRLEWGEYKGPRHTVFLDDESCPEMRT